MNKKEFGKWMRNRRLERGALYFELAYAVVLLLTLLFAFSLFMHLIVLQGILISLYLLIGWIDEARSKDEQIIKVNKRDTLRATISSIRINRRFFYRLFEAIVVIAALVAALLMLRPIWAYLLQAPNPHVSEARQNWNLYSNFTEVISQIVLMIAILTGKRKVLRDTSVLILCLSFISFFTQTQLLTTEIIAFLVGLSSLIMTRANSTI